MNEYRKTIPLSTTTPYWFVEMGVLNRLNGEASYPFPTPEAAGRFALFHKRRDPHRDVQIRYPDGTVEVTE